MRVVILILAFVLVVPNVWAQHEEKKAMREAQHEKMKAHRMEQKGENQEFRKSLEGKSKEEKISAMKAHRFEQHGENIEFSKQAHAERMARLKEELAKKENLTQAQKDELINFRETQYQNALKHREGQFGENQAFMDKIANDPSMTPEQRKEAMKAHFRQQHSENKEFRGQMRDGMKAERQKIHKEVKSAAQASK